MEERKEDIAADDFFAIDMRVGRVLSVDEFPEARRPSYRLRVDFGETIGELETVAQATHYPKDELVGRLVVGAVNLGSKRIAGAKSQFLLLGAADEEGRARLLRVEDDLEPGSPIF
jgi:tRNA-binding protein